MTVLSCFLLSVGLIYNDHLSCLLTNESLAQLLSAHAIGAGGLRFDYRTGQIGRSVANGSPPLQRFFGAV